MTKNCPFCDEVNRDDYGCHHCDAPCCENCVVYVETHAATFIDPDEGIYICPDCVSSNESAAEDAAIRAAEERAEQRAMDRAYYDDMRW